MRFADGATRYLEESRDKRTVDVTAWHIRLLTPYIGTLELNRIHDRTLERFVTDRIAEGVSATTINRSLEVVRTVLNRAARSYRDDEGHPWLEGMPPLISMLPETRRPPYPITWEEQDRLFRSCPHGLRGWFYSQSIPDCGKATCVDWNGRGRLRCPKSGVAYS